MADQRHGTQPESPWLFEFLLGPDAFWRVWRANWRMRRATRRYLRSFDD